MPKVLHIISGLDVGGAEMALLRFVTCSAGGPYQHAVVSLSRGGGMLERFRSAGIEVTQLGLKKAPLRTLVYLFKLLRTSRPAVVQTWMYHADLVGGLVARLAGIRHVIWGVRTTDVSVNGGAGIRYLQKVCAIFSRLLPQRIVCAADASKESHIGIGYAPDRMVAVPNGFDFSRFQRDEDRRQSFRAEHGIAGDTIVVGTLGRFHLAKDPENYVRAAGLLAKTRPDVKYMMVGRDFVPANQELMRWIDKSGCKDSFILLGERSDVPLCLSAMDVFCLPSSTEGFPNALAEAMAMGLPAVTTDVGDARVLLQDAGYVVPKQDSQALAEALGRLLALSADRRHSLGNEASRRVRSEYGLDRMRSRFESIYEELIKNSEG